MTAFPNPGVGDIQFLPNLDDLFAARPSLMCRLHLASDNLVNADDLVNSAAAAARSTG